MPRKTLMYGIAILAIVVIVGAYVGWTFIKSNPPSPTPSPSATPKVSPSPEVPIQEQVRDAAMTLMATNHSETQQVMVNLSWTGGRQDTGLSGAEKYLYTSSNWTVLIQYPVVPNPTYTISANYTAGDVKVEWQGTYQNDTIAETNCVTYNLGPIAY